MGGVAEFRAGLRQERIIGKELQTPADRIFEVPDVTHFRIIVRFGTVMPNATQMRQQLAGGDWRLFLGKCRAILLHRGIQVQFAALRELHRGHGGEGLRDGREPVECLGSCGHESFQVCHSESRRPDILAILDDGDREARGLISRHEFGYGLFNPLALIVGELGNLTECGLSGRKGDGKAQDKWEDLLCGAVP